MKNYVGIARDHSGSMSHLRNEARADYNLLIRQLKSASDEEKIDTIVNTVGFGYQYSAPVQLQVVNSSVNAVSEITDYPTEGSTPLFDAVGKLIDTMERVPDVDSPDVTFLVMAVTDGEENASIIWRQPALCAKIKTLQATDRWTFAFRVPKGYGSRLATSLGIPAGNIVEWEQTQQGIQQSSTQTQSAIKKFYQQRKTGVTRSTGFYTDLSGVSMKDVKSSLEDISTKVEIWQIPLPRDRSKKIEIREFVEKKIKPKQMQLGTAFYQLSKREEVQDHKLIVIRHKISGKVYGGREARSLLGLPDTGSIKLAPGDHGQYDVFVQSTSVNRHLVPETDLLYWPGARSI